MVIIQYDGTAVDMQRIIDEQTARGLLLVEVQNVKEGNFLGFSDSPNAQKTPIEQEIDKLKQRDAQIQDDNNVIMEALITAGII